MSKNKYKGMRRIFHAVIYSMDGLIATFKSEAAFKQECFLVLVTFPFVFWLDVDLISKVLLVSSVLLILIAELANTAIEAVVDRISLEQHPLSKKAKDVGSAIVLMAFVNGFFVWGTIIFHTFL